MKLTSLIIDDEPACRDVLNHMLVTYCPDIEVIGMASSVAMARAQIEHCSPDVVFLDIEMPQEDGFDFLRSVPNQFMTVFTTAYSQHALKAIKASAIDYLLKPIEVDELKNAARKLSDKRQALQSSDEKKAEHAQGLSVLEDNLRRHAYIEKLNIPHTKGFKVVAVADITHLTAQSNYTTIHLVNKQSIIASVPLKEFEGILDSGVFFRAHKSHIVNLDYIDEYTTEDGGYIILKDGTWVELSKRRLPAFLHYMNTLHWRVRK